MSYHILFKGIHFVLSYSMQTWKFIAGNLFKIKKPGKMKHAYNKDKRCSIILKRLPKGGVT